MAARRPGPHGWQRWAPYAAVAWSVGYATLVACWAVSGRGFPYTAGAVSDPIGPLLGRFRPAAAWGVVTIAGMPAASLGIAMLTVARSGVLRPLFLTAGAALTGVLLLLMTSLGLLVLLGYVPYVVWSVFAGHAIGARFVKGLTHWATIHQVLCLLGGFLWLGATVCYARRSGGACVSCGRRDGPGGWQTPDRAARWGRIAVCLSTIAPVFYALTRYAWALGFPLGMSEEFFRRGQQKGLWTSGLFLANFGLAGAVLTFGLIQRWGEVFPRWMTGLRGRRVPIALAVVPASIVSVLLVVGGIVIWSGLDRMIAALAAGRADGTRIVAAVFFQVGPTLLFPVWGIALAVAALGYYYRRRGPCRVCGRGTVAQPDDARRPELSLM